MRARVTVTLAFVFLATQAGHTQVSPPMPIPPSPGFVSSYEIMRTLRSAGFDPLAPPLREGTIYVARATDYRGILMRIVLDARTGAIRDANRIVPGRRNADAFYRENYGPGPIYGPGRYGRGGLEPLPHEQGPMGKSLEPPLAHSAIAPPAPPLPRPRPPELASRGPAASITPAAAVAPEAASKPQDSSKASTTEPDAKTATVPVAPAPAPSSKAPSTLTINN